MQRSIVLFTLLCVVALIFPVRGGTGQTIVGSVDTDPAVYDLDASEARLKYPISFCVDPRNGDMYIGDDFFLKIFKVDHQTNTVSWFAGNGIESTCTRSNCNNKSDKLSVGMKTPVACAVDPNNGDLYLVDYNNHMVRKIDASTNISSIIIGTGVTTGSNTNFNGIDAMESTVTLNSPTSILVDSNFIYIADTSNHCIRKINKNTNLVYTHAGSCGTLGNVNGNTPTDARFNNPNDMAVAADGTMFIADKSNHVIRRINPDGSVELYAGTIGTPCPSPTGSCGDGTDRLNVTFKLPNSVAVDSNSNVYVFDYQDYRIRKIDNATGLVSTIVGTGASTNGVTGGPAGHGQIGTSVIITASSTLQHMKIVGNKLLFHDKAMGRVRQYDMNSQIVTSLVGGGNSIVFGAGMPLINSRFSTGPVMQFDSNGTPYIFTGHNPALFLTVTQKGIVKVLAGGTGTNTPIYSDVPGDQIVLSTGASPVKFVIDKSNNQDIYIADQARVRYYNVTSARMYTYAGGGGSSTSGTAALSFSFGTISSMAMLSNGDLVVISSSNKSIRKIVKSSGTVVILNTAGTTCSTSSCGDGGLVSAASFSTTLFVATDSNDNIYIMDSGVFVLRMIRPNGTIDRVAGTYTTQCTSGNTCGDGGSALSATLGTMKDIEINPVTGDIYLAEQGTNRIRKISGGIISTVVGVSGRAYDTLASGAWANPLDMGVGTTRITFSPTGQLYFNDGGAYWSMRTLKDGVVRHVNGFLVSNTDKFTYNGEGLNPTKVKLPLPTSVFLDANGNIFVGCSGMPSAVGGETDARIVKVDAISNTASTFIGSLTDNAVVSENTIGTRTVLKPYANIYTGLYVPFGIHVTSSGDIYFSDPSHYVVRMYNATLGTVSTIAGTMSTVCPDTICENGQSALGAHFKLPTSIFVTDDGTIHVADTLLHQIRKIKNGIISAVAGTGTQCVTSGSISCDHGSTSPLSVDLYHPMGIYVTKSGEVYFADFSNHKVRKISSDGLTITTVAGSEGCCSSGSTVADPCAVYSASANDTTAKLFYPTSVVVNETTGAIYIADQGTHTIRIVSPDGSMSVYAGTFPGAAFNGVTQFGIEGSSKYLNLPTGIFLKDNAIYVTEPFLGRVRRVTRNCLDGYAGDNCDVLVCFGILATDSLVCSGHGSCVGNGTNSCQCNAGWSGSNCSQSTGGNAFTCYGVASSDVNACSGHGTCSSSDHCSCNSNYYGEKCNITTCGGVFSNDSSVCSGHGACVDFNNCSCLQNSGSNCADVTIPSVYCFGVLSNDSNVCSGNGVCNATDVCICDSPFFGIECSYETNTDNGTYSSNTTSTDNSTNLNNSTSMDNNTNINNTTNADNSTATNTTDTSANNNTTTNTNNSTNMDNSTFSNNTDNSTKTNSTDTNTNGTTTNSTNYTNNTNSDNTVTNGTNTGNNNQWNCYGIANNDSSVCSGHGTCKSPNSCDCGTGYLGSECELRSCFGVANNNPNSCSGNGNCTAIDTCQCRAGYSGSKCEEYKCNGVLSSNTSACSGNGNCTAPNVCLCASYAGGSLCETTYCNGISSTNQTVCNGIGSCVLGVCKCPIGYLGKGCEYNITGSLSGQYIVSESNSYMGVYYTLFIFIGLLFVNI